VAASGASVPEASVYEHREAFAGKEEIGTPW